MTKSRAINRVGHRSKQLRDRIHKESKFADTHKNLPYSFSKPTKSKPLRVAFECKNCGRASGVTDETIVVICGGCGEVTRMKDFRKKGF